MAWLEAHQSLKDHHKTLDAADHLEIEPHEMVGHLLFLWWWALDNAPDGDITHIKPRTIARVAEWKQDPQQFIDALIMFGFLDQEGESLFIHDWNDYAGKLIDRRVAERERSRQRRQQKPAAKPKREKPAEQPPVDQGATAGQPLAQYSTVPNSTVPGDTPPYPPQGGVGTGDEKTQGESLPVEMAQGSGNPPVDHSTTPANKRTSLAERFEVFYKAYPNKKNRGQAEKTWNKIKPDDKLLADMLASLEQAKKSFDWTKDGGQFIPHPSTWLNAKGWLNEYTPANTQEADAQQTVAQMYGGRVNRV